MINYLDVILCETLCFSGLSSKIFNAIKTQRMH